MTQDEPLSPVVIFFKGTSVEANLYYGEPDVLQRLPTGSVHILLSPLPTAENIDEKELFRVRNFKSAKVPWNQLYYAMKDFGNGCCPECHAPWVLDFNMLSMEDSVMPSCQCQRHDPVPCVVLDLQAGDGTVALAVLKAGLEYLGIEGSRPELLGMACRKVQGGTKA